MNHMTKIGVALVALSIALTGCSTTKNWLGKRNNGSLDYQQSQKIDPIKLPVNQATAEFTPLYQTPNLGASPINLTNDSGKQYELPKPPTAAH
ncbi:hypothetical protein [Moraxella ovis]|uniref:hypothetical protein n=1 Tax=Moraxella ovis TaxID=29433 RepID=UPI000DA0E65A|nr:hypothetical protein [Moraxella ovis]SPX81514.1 Uncharacterised protein [Moraxella ovis]STZ05903.1 Uncharacterised protein [Moraxella ovis]